MRKLLLIYTGGTIGMITNAQTGALESFDFSHLYAQIPELKRFELDIQVKSFDTPLDSSEIGPQHWQQLASWISDSYNEFDGFVVLHGTDTMAYTASALSFMLQGLRKPVVFTGSQLPIGIIRTDGKENLITAIEIAAATDAHGEPILQEVAVYFEYALFRGNRTSKISAHQFEAFAAPNYPLLAKAGVQIEWFKERLFRTEHAQLKPQLALSNEVLIWRLFPGMPVNLYETALVFPNVKILLIETFGAGNAFSDSAFQAMLASFIEAGGLVLNITQCQSGAVRQGAYQTSTFFEKIGVISGADLTAEAALTKCMFALANVDQVTRAQFLRTAVVGELSNPEK
jgi:L-asparaginase